RRTDYHHGLAALVFRRQPHLIAGEVDADRARLSGRREIERAPIDRDLADADAEKAAEVDDGGAHLSVAADDDVDDAPHVFAGVAANALAEDGGAVLVVEHHGRGTGGRIWWRGACWGCGCRRWRLLLLRLSRRRRRLRRLHHLPRRGGSRRAVRPRD